MKREIFIIIFILAIISILHGVSQTYTNNFFNSVLEDIDEIERKISNSRFDEVERDINNLKNKWEGKFKYLSCFMEHDELEKVQSQLISMSANIKVKDYNRAVDEAEKCKFILKHISEKDSMKIRNIF